MTTRAMVSADLARFHGAVADEIRREWFRGTVGRQMWCKSCGTVLDCKDSVEITIRDLEKNEYLNVVLLCSVCADDKIARVRDMVADHNARNDPSQIRFPGTGERANLQSVEVTDGRVLWPPNVRKQRTRRSRTPAVCCNHPSSCTRKTTSASALCATHRKAKS